MKVFSKISIILMGLVSIMLTSVSTQAEQMLKGTSFYKEVKHPENQISSGEALDLMMEPGQKQQVTVEIVNITDEEIIVESRLSGARTNGNGGLEYGPNEFLKDDSMKYDLSDLVSIPSEVNVPAKGKADLILDIEMPETPYDGIVTGGIQLIEKDKSVITTDEKGATIENKVAFLFGVTLRMSDKEVSPNFNSEKAYGGLQNFRNAMIVEIANTESMIAKDLSLNVDIKKQGSDDVLYSKKKADVSMAPNSIMAFPIGLDGERMKADSYTADVVLKGYNQEWTWSVDFEVTEEEADQFNKQDPYLVQERGINFQLIAILVGAGIGIILLIWIIKKALSKDKKSIKKTSKSKKSKGKR